MGLNEKYQRIKARSVDAWNAKMDMLETLWNLKIAEARGEYRKEHPQPNGESDLALRFKDITD